MKFNTSKYTHEIKIFIVENKEDEYGRVEPDPKLFTKCWAQVKTLRADDLFINDISPEKAYTRFIIRYSKKVMDAYYDSPYMLIEFRG